MGICTVVATTSSGYSQHSFHFDASTIIKLLPQKVWDVSTFQCVKSITGHYGSIYSIAIAERYLLAGIFENAIMV